MSRKHRFESSSLQYLYDKHVAGNKALEDIYEEELVNASVARQLYESRKAAKLGQAELAKLAQTTTSVISRLENPSYRSHSLTMVTKIAALLGKKVEVRLVAVKTAPRKIAAHKKVHKRKSIHASA